MVFIKCSLGDSLFVKIAGRHSLNYPLISAIPLPWKTCKKTCLQTFSRGVNHSFEGFGFGIFWDFFGIFWDYSSKVYGIFSQLFTPRIYLTYLNLRLHQHLMRLQQLQLKDLADWLSKAEEVISNTPPIASDLEVVKTQVWTYRGCRGWPKIQGAEKVLASFWVAKIKGGEIFSKPLYNIKTKTKKFYL